MLPRAARSVAGVALGSTARCRRYLTVEAKAVRFHKHGHPTSVLKVESVKYDSSAMKSTDVLVRILAAPITPADLSQVTGNEGKAPSLPRTGGNEGVGIVMEAGSDSSLAKGDIVVASRPGVGTWATHVVAPGDSFTKVPAGGPQPGDANFPVEVAAVSVAAPLLAKALLQSVPLADGDVVIQNNAGSTVGQAVIQYAAAKGLRTVNIMRPRSDWGDISNHLQGRGATIVVDETYARTPAFSKLLADLPAPHLGLNSVGGPAFTSVAKALGRGATLVTYGGVARQPIRVSSCLLTGKGAVLKGFSLAEAVAKLDKATRDAAVAAVVADVRGGEAARVKLLVAREPFSDFPIALKRSLARGERKIVLVMPKA